MPFEGDTSPESRVGYLGIEDGGERERPRCTEMNLKDGCVSYMIYQAAIDNGRETVPHSCTTTPASYFRRS